MDGNDDKTLKRNLLARRLLRAASVPLKCNQGQALVEFGLVAIVFLLLVFGIIDFARLFQSWVTVQHAAREGARYALTGRSDCDAYGDNRVGCIMYQAQQATTGLDGAPGAVSVSVESWSYPTYATPHPGSAGNACDEVEVKVDYDHHLITPIIASIVSHVPLEGRERVLNEPFGPCGSP